MGIEQKKNAGTYLGDQEKHTSEKPASGNGVRGAAFKKGQILDGLPGSGDNFPKAGKDIAPSFQDLRNSDSSKGKI